MLTRLLPSVRIIIAGAVAALTLAPLRAAAADCTVQLRSVVFGAQSSAHDFVSYAVRLNGEPQTGTVAQLSLKLSNGTSTEVAWPDVTIEKPELKDEVPTAIGSFDRRKADVISASVDAVSPAPGQRLAPCHGQEAALNATDNNPWGFEVLNARKHVFSASVVTAPVVHHKSSDAVFITKVAPDYPVAERNANIQGDVTVRFTVGIDGHVSHAIVVDSSQDDGLDNAALEATRQTTLHPATVDGVPTAVDYLIVYTFRLQEGSREPNITFTGTSAPKSNCPLSATSMRLVNSGSNNGPDWYSMYFTATRTDIVAADVEFLDAASEEVTVPWEAIELAPLDKDGTTQIEAAIPWTGADPLKLWVANVKYADGHQLACSTYYELVERPDTAGPLPRTLAPSTQTVRVETRRYEAPLVESYPTYPPASIAADVTGGVGIDVVVDDAGKVTGALVISSSNSADLDNAALSAAMKTRFAPRQSGTYFPMRVYHLDYEFQDNIE